MRNIVILNPNSGKVDSGKSVKELFAPYMEEYSLEIYETKSEKDATAYCRKVLSETDEKVRFIACGGDGTFNEVATACVGNDNASVTIFPTGSGNDFVKYYGSKERFLDPKKILDAKDSRIDVIGVNDMYSFNVFNFGFDSVVCDTMIKVKRKPVIGGKRAYTTGIVNALLRGMKTKCRIVCDGKTFLDGNMLLCTMANGNYVGGQFKCAPRSKNDDGLIDVCMVSVISRIKFVQLLGVYTNGEHLDNDKFSDIIHYCQAKEIVLSADEPLLASLDGEMVSSREYRIRCLPGALNFAVPDQE